MNLDPFTAVSVKPSVARDADAQLRQTLRDALTQSPGEGLNDLQARVMAQWTLRSAPVGTVAGRSGGVLQLGLHSLRVQVVMLALVVVAVLGWQGLRSHSETALDDLLEPDVLSLMALGEL